MYVFIFSCFPLNIFWGSALFLNFVLNINNNFSVTFSFFHKWVRDMDGEKPLFMLYLIYLDWLGFWSPLGVFSILATLSFFRSKINVTRNRSEIGFVEEHFSEQNASLQYKIFLLNYEAERIWIVCGPRNCVIWPRGHGWTSTTPLAWLPTCSGSFLPEWLRANPIFFFSHSLHT